MVSTLHALRPTEDAPLEEEAVQHEPGPTSLPIEHLFASEDLVSTERESPQREIHYERGSVVYALDGPVGTLRQIVIDEDMAEVKALVIRMSAKNESVLMPPELVDKCVGSSLILNVTKEQFAMGASRSPRFDPRMFTGADIKSLTKIIPLAFRGKKQRSVVSIDSDVVQTSEVLDPASLPRARRSWWKRFR